MLLSTLHSQCIGSAIQTSLRLRVTLFCVVYITNECRRKMTTNPAIGYTERFSVSRSHRGD